MRTATVTALVAGPGAEPAVFASVDEAVAAALAAAADGTPVGLAVGELTSDGGAWSGPALAVAAALADHAAGRRTAAGVRADDGAAGGGRVVATAVLAALTALAPGGRRPDVAWRALGPLAAGATGPVECVEAVRSSAAEAVPAPAPGPGADAVPPALPAAFGPAAEFPFVGRAAAWDALARAWEEADGGARRVVLLGGEAGSGKTRLVSEFGRWAHGRGGVVLYGGCSEASVLPYEPFAAALDQLAAALPPAERARLVAGPGRALARLAPRLAAGLPGAAAEAGPGVGDGRETTRPASGTGCSAPWPRRWERWPARAAAAAGPRRPALGRRSTVELLDHLVRAPAPVRLCLVGTYRSTPSEVGEGLRAALPDLRRRPGVSRLVLGGLDRDEVRRFVRGAAGDAPVAGLEATADVLAGETGGNPFLLGERWRDLTDAGVLTRTPAGWRLAAAPAGLASPEGVREAVELRLDRLPEATRRLVHAAAVAGTDFSLPIVADAVGQEVGAAVAALDPAVGRATGRGGRAGGAPLRPCPGPPGRGRRAGRRRAAGAPSGAGRHAGPPTTANGRSPPSPTTWSRPCRWSTPARAVAAARRAAAAARRAVAYDDAARLLEAVLPLVPPDRERGTLLLDLADARMCAGDVDAARERCLEATALAGELDDPALTVDAALAYDDASWRTARPGDVAEPLLRAALPLVADPVTAVRVRAALSRALALAGRSEEGEALAAETVAEARRLGGYTERRIAYAAALFLPWTPANLDRQRLLARELVERAQDAGDVEWELGAMNKVLYGAVTAGDLDEARAVAAGQGGLADRLGQPLFRVLTLQAAALLAMGEGRFADAEALAEEADGLGVFLSGSDAAGGYGVQLFGIRREQGRLDEARPLVEAVARLDRVGATWRPALTVLQAELGLHEDAAAGLAVLVADGLAAVPRDSLWWASLSYLADAAVALGDRDAAAVVYGELVAARGLVVQVGNLLAAYGSADRPLGALCTVLGRHRDAEAHFETALRVDRRAAMPVWLAHTHLAYARFLAQRRRPGDLERAASMLRAAGDTAAACGMARVDAEAAAALVGVTEARAAAPSATLRPVPSGTAGAAAGPDRPSRPAAAAALTARELAILPLLARGLTNREVGERLHISQHTAANHLRSILLKTGCANRTEAAAWALRHGLADP